MEMLPRLGGRYELEIETTSKLKAEYHTDAYYALDLPAAPAIMIEEEVVVEGKDLGEEELEAAIRRRLGLPEHERGGAKGFFGRFR